ncbi:MAG: hypothetical protein HN904_05195 [Victivallales bacterium]|jgi:hypothetical protein|nr:hypothetical protein [Victivallales bacterium]MBT7162151.1 hypothetical protein [Victivallales bacterium]
MDDCVHPHAHVEDAAGKISPRHQPAYCPILIDSRDFQLGDVVSIRWNPHTNRITAAKLASP